MKHFHQFVKEKRIEKGISLRQFCRECELDPSNWSKIERGIGDAPKGGEILERIAGVLKFSREDFNSLKDLALIDAIPEDLRPKESILEKLPIFFRTARGEKPTESELQTIYTLLEKANSK